MSRRKARKPRRPRPGGAGRVFVETLHGQRVLMPGVTARDYDWVKALAEAGDLDAPEVTDFVMKFADLIGARSQLDFEDWTAADWREFLLGVLVWLGFVAGDVWTPADDSALAALLSGEGASGV